MKHLKLFEGFADIDVICKKYGITYYRINPDGTVADDAEFTFTTSLSLNLDCNVLIN